VYDVAEPLSSFSWHPSRSKLLTINSSSVVEVINVHESMPVAFSPLNEMAFAYTKELVEATLQQSDSDEAKLATLKGEGDMSLVMHARAQAGYSGDVRVSCVFLSQPNSNLPASYCCRYSRNSIRTWPFDLRTRSWPMCGIGSMVLLDALYFAMCVFKADQLIRFSCRYEV
jgi:hypothetical protein